MVLFTLVIRSRCFEIVHSVGILFRRDIERYKSENVKKRKLRNSALSFDGTLNDINNCLVILHELCVEF